MGDKINKTFADSFNHYKRGEDFFGRWGGDEFVLITPNFDLKNIKSHLEEIYPKVLEDMKSVISYSSFCYGTAEYRKEENDYQELITRADNKLYEWKRRLKKGKMSLQ